eukprot:6323769-Alexandrium_andersonii.AAC.1
MKHPQVTSLVSCKVEKTVHMLEHLLLEVSSIGERGVTRVEDSVSSRMFRIAGLFREFGCASLMAKLCLNWIDMWRSGETPHGKMLLDPPCLLYTSDAADDM